MTEADPSTWLDLGKVGPYPYTIKAHRFQTDEQDVGTIYANSEFTPIEMAIYYGDRKKPEEEEGERTRFRLGWLTELPREEVVEVIRDFGAQLQSPEYFCISPHDDESYERVETDLDKVVRPDFTLLRILTREPKALAWQVDEGGEGDTTSFHVLSSATTPLAVISLQPTIERSIPAAHIGSVAAALETLGHVLYVYDDNPPSILTADAPAEPAQE